MTPKIIVKKATIGIKVVLLALSHDCSVNSFYKLNERRRVYITFN